MNTEALSRCYQHGAYPRELNQIHELLTQKRIMKARTASKTLGWADLRRLLEFGMGIPYDPACSIADYLVNDGSSSLTPKQVIKLLP